MKLELQSLFVVRLGKPSRGVHRLPKSPGGWCCPQVRLGAPWLHHCHCQCYRVTPLKGKGPASGSPGVPQPTSLGTTGRETGEVLLTLEQIGLETCFPQVGQINQSMGWAFKVPHLVSFIQMHCIIFIFKICSYVHTHICYIRDLASTKYTRAELCHSTPTTTILPSALPRHPSAPQCCE